VRSGIDPIEARKKQSTPAPVTSDMTFDLATAGFDIRSDARNICFAKSS
jgi:hypothetical protein